MEKKFIRVDEVAKELEISESHAYKIMRKLNRELEAKGYETNTAPIRSLADIMSFLFELNKVSSIKFDVDVKKPPRSNEWTCSIRFNGKEMDADHNADMCLFLEQWEEMREDVRSYNCSPTALHSWQEQTLAYYCAGVRELEDHGYVVRERVRNANGQLGSIEYTILEQPRLRQPEPEKPKQENPVQVNPVLDSPVLGKPEQENPAQLNKDISSNYLSNTDSSSIDISNPIQSNPPTPAGARMGTDGMGTREIYREIILENIDYEILASDPKVDREQLDEITELIVDTVCTARKTVRISGDDFPAEVVKSRFLKLNSTHIQYVMDCMKDNTTYVRNIKKYLLAALYNAPSTISNYYSALVQHDMYGGGQRGRP